MAKDPAFLFYYQDFLVGVEFMDDAEVGKYIRILCHLAHKGTLTEKQVLSICKASAIPENILDKLDEDEFGNYYNKRLQEETEKRRKFTESRRKNAASAKHMPKHMENENENEDDNESVIKKELLLPIEINNVSGLENKYREWLEYRKEMKWKKLTQSGINKQIAFLLKQPDPIAVIDKSIMNGYQGLFEIKGDKNNGSIKRGITESELRELADEIANDPDLK